MSDLNPEFNVFHQKISLSTSQEKMMRNLRQSLRRRIMQHFHEKLNLRPPIFSNRGRQATATAVAPAYEEMVLEEGALLQHIHPDAMGKWPKPEIVHLLMLNAIQKHTPDPPIDRKSSICVRYAGIFRIEISILAPGPDGNQVAINGARSWQPDMHGGFAAWFKNQIKHQGLQLQRVARYLHAWADFHPNQLERFAWQLPLDILAARYFQADIERDDKSLARTAAALAEAAPGDFRRPISSGKDNAFVWPLSRQENRIFFQSLEVLVERSRLAVTTRDKMHACAIWRSLLGSRFPMAGMNTRKFNGAGRRWSPPGHTRF